MFLLSSFHLSVWPLSGGRMRALGSPLYLKNKFGSGYIVRLMSSPAGTQTTNRQTDK